MLNLPSNVTDITIIRRELREQYGLSGRDLISATGRTISHLVALRESEPYRDTYNAGHTADCPPSGRWTGLCHFDPTAPFADRQPLVSYIESVGAAATSAYEKAYNAASEILAAHQNGDHRWCDELDCDRVRYNVTEPADIARASAESDAPDPNAGAELPQHAFTVGKIDFHEHAWHWTCACGWDHVQLDGEQVQAVLIAHARGES